MTCSWPEEASKRIPNHSRREALQGRHHLLVHMFLPHCSYNRRGGRRQRVQSLGTEAAVAKQELRLGPGLGRSSPRLRWPKGNGQGGGCSLDPPLLPQEPPALLHLPRGCHHPELEEGEMGAGMRWERTGTIADAAVWLCQGGIPAVSMRSSGRCFLGKREGRAGGRGAPSVRSRSRVTLTS